MYRPRYRQTSGWPATRGTRGPDMANCCPCPASSRSLPPRADSPPAVHRPKYFTQYTQTSVPRLGGRLRIRVSKCALGPPPHVPPRMGSEEALHDLLSRFYPVEERLMRADLAWMQCWRTETYGIRRVPPLEYEIDTPPIFSQSTATSSDGKPSSSTVYRSGNPS